MALLPLIRLGADANGPLEGRARARTLPASTSPCCARCRVRVLHRPLVSPQLLVAYRAPAQLDPDFAAVEMLSDVLVSGDSARLARSLVTEHQIATEVQGYLSPFAEPGLYEILVTVRTGVDPWHVLDVLQQELDELAEGLTPREITKAQNSLELSTLNDFRDAEGCAEALGHYETNYGDFGLAFAALDRFRAVDAAALARVAADIFRLDNRCAVVALPEDAGESE